MVVETERSTLSSPGSEILPTGAPLLSAKRDPASISARGVRDEQDFLERFDKLEAVSIQSHASDDGAAAAAARARARAPHALCPLCPLALSRAEAQPGFATRAEPEAKRSDANASSVPAFGSISTAHKSQP